MLRKALDLPHAETGNTLKGTDLESPDTNNQTTYGNSQETGTTSYRTATGNYSPQYQNGYNNY